MAQRKAKTESVINRALLAMIAAASAANNIYYVTQADGVPLLQAGLIEVDETNLQDGKAASRITVAGVNYLNGGDTMNTATQSAASPYGVIKGAQLPPSKRGFGLRGGGAPKLYPFETMEVGDSFFVEVSAKHPNPVKTLGSTVSSANLRYAETVGEKEVVRNKRGKKNKLVLDAAGQPIPETVKVPVHKYTRRFSIRPVEAGKQYGEWTAPAAGALIARTQ